mgnify:CR=1 FL=1
MDKKKLNDNEKMNQAAQKINEANETADEMKMDVYFKKRNASNKAKFSQLIIENVQYILDQHPNYLSTAEYATLLKLFSLTSKYYNKIVRYEKRTGYGYKSTAQDSSITDIANFIDESRGNLSKKINSLIKKGIIFEDKEKIIEDDSSRKTNSVGICIF